MIWGCRHTGGATSPKRRGAAREWSDAMSCQDARPGGFGPGGVGLRRVARQGASGLDSKGTSTEPGMRQALTERVPDVRVRASGKEEAVHGDVGWRADRSNGFGGIREAGHAGETGEETPRG